MCLVWLLAVSLVVAETAPCSLSDVREGAAAAQGRERLSPQEFSHVCNTVNATAQGFTPLASRGSILKEDMFAITRVASAEPPLSLVSEKERFLEMSVCCVFSGGSLGSPAPQRIRSTRYYRHVIVQRQGPLHRTEAAGRSPGGLLESSGVRVARAASPVSLRSIWPPRDM
jgi:hypothetical protein